MATELSDFGLVHLFLFSENIKKYPYVLKFMNSDKAENLEAVLAESKIDTKDYQALVKQGEQLFREKYF